MQLSLDIDDAKTIAERAPQISDERSRARVIDRWFRDNEAIAANVDAV